jgi:phosphoribosylformylglycinamidine (FGAM) synthase-like enzyme
MWQFTEASRGIADGCYTLGIPVTGGNVSFYNQTGSTPINPTPVIGVLGVIDDVTRRTSIGFRADAEELFLLGETREEFGGSEWAHVVHDHLGGRPPVVDLAAERALANVLIDGAAFLTAAHDLADGGLAQAVVESCLRGRRGASISLPPHADPFVALFSESAARAIVAVRADDVATLTELAATHGVSMVRLGFTGGEAFEVAGLFAIPVSHLRAASDAPFAAAFG